MGNYHGVVRYEHIIIAHETVFYVQIGFHVLLEKHGQKTHLSQAR